MSKRIDVKDLNVYYGNFLAVQDVNINIEAKSVTAFIGPSGCGKSTFLRTLNRMHEVLPGARVEGEVLLDGDNLYGPGVDPVTVRTQVGMVFQRPNPFPTMSIRDNVLAGVKLNNKRISKGAADALVEKSLVGANLWNEVKDRLDKPGSLKDQYTVVIVTHNMQQAARVSDKTAFFNIAGTGKPGRLIEFADTTTIFNNPSQKATEDYVSGRFG